MLKWLIARLDDRQKRNREDICIKITEVAKELSEDNPRVLVLGYLAQASNYETLVFTLTKLYEETKRNLDNFIAEDPETFNEMKRIMLQSSILYYFITFFGGRLGLFWI